MKEIYHKKCGSRVQRREHIGDGHWAWDLFCLECKDILTEEDCDSK